MASSDADLIDRFLEMMAAERGVALNTIAAYQSDLVAASKLTGGQLADADAAMLAKLAGQWGDLANSSVARKSSALRRFYGFLHEEGLRRDNPSAALPKPAQARGLPKILDRHEVDALFAAVEQRLARTKPTPADYRLSALIELLYGSGLRATELVALSRASVVSDRPYIILMGKGSKERLVPISDRARQAVGVWQAFVPKDSRYLFPSRNAHISRIRLFQIIKALASCLCYAPAGGRREPARIAGDARTRRHCDDANLYACRCQSSGRAGQ
jgi:integrase/recombinase XerD